jgi:hypothetical protein
VASDIIGAATKLVARANPAAVLDRPIPASKDEVRALLQDDTLSRAEPSATGQEEDLNYSDELGLILGNVFLTDENKLKMARTLVDMAATEQQAALGMFGPDSPKTHTITRKLLRAKKTLTDVEDALRVHSGQVSLSGVISTSSARSKTQSIKSAMRTGSIASKRKASGGSVKSAVSAVSASGSRASGVAESKEVELTTPPSVVSVPKPVQSPTPKSTGKREGARKPESTSMSKGQATSAVSAEAPSVAGAVAALDETISKPGATGEEDDRKPPARPQAPFLAALGRGAGKPSPLAGLMKERAATLAQLGNIAGRGRGRPVAGVPILPTPGEKQPQLPLATQYAD